MEEPVITAVSDALDLIVLEYTIPLVTLDLQEQNFTCVVLAGDATYVKTVYIEVQGIWVFCFVFGTGLIYGTYVHRCSILPTAATSQWISILHRDYCKWNHTLLLMTACCFLYRIHRIHLLR